MWAVLTNYEALADVVPNLAVSERLVLPPDSPPNLVRLRQVGTLHAYTFVLGRVMATQHMHLGHSNTVQKEVESVGECKHSSRRLYVDHGCLLDA